MAIQSPSSSSSFTSAFTYQVFLSFRGSDTRKGFTGNLYNALTEKGIHTFIDDIDLPRGDEITPSLVKAIEESRILIPIFSANYAYSSFCLDELVHIIHCYKTKGRLTLPIFVGVDPTDVRHHTGSYGEDLTKHEKRFQNNQKNMERLYQWKMALTQAANLSGYHYSTGYQYKFIGKIVEDISDKINHGFLHVAKYPVGLQARVQRVKLLLDKECKEGVRMVGLYGTGGLGKSTLAKAIYNLVGDQFEVACFLHKVRENSTRNNLKHLQEELLSKISKVNIKLGDVSEGITIIKERLSRKKILLILDDVDKLDQLEALAGGLDWFGHGSRVIITTRDKHLLTCHGIECMHAVEGLYGAEALELLRLTAFKNGKVPSSYKDILIRALTYASGLPLAIVIIGSNLFGRSVEDWERTLNEYEKIPNKEIQKILKVSYDALEEKEKSVFLDIACFFNGCEWKEVKEILDTHYGHCIKYHVKVLAEKSLIDKYFFHVTLHDLIEDMGKEVVRQESPNKPEKRSRLWFHNEIVDILQNNKGTRNIEMIYLNCSSMENVINWNGKAFEKMTNLKTLIVKNGNFSRGPEYLPSSLKFLEWKGCPLKSLSSCISNKEFNYMKVLTLDNCQYLNHIPNVSGFPNLKKFSFTYCKNLTTIHNSIWNLNKLEILNAKGCKKLKSFPQLRLPSLKELKLSYCESLKSFPELLCKMTNIKEILLWGTSIGELPFSFQYLSELRRLERSDGIFRFPKHNDKMYSIVFSKLELLNLENNNLSDECLQTVLKWCVNLKFLDLSCNKFKILPECLSECHLLRYLKLDNCKYLEEIRGIPPNLKEFSAGGCESLSSSSRRMLMSQKLHEAGGTHFYLPNETQFQNGIPDWFEHKSKGRRISFLFRKKIPSIISIFLIQVSRGGDLKSELVVNGHECLLGLGTQGTQLFDLRLEEWCERTFHTNLYQTLLKNEWIRVEIKLTILDYFSDKENNDISEDEKIEILSRAQMGIHVLKDKSNTEEDVIFINQDGLSEDEILQQQHIADVVSDMRNLVLTETKEKEHHLAFFSQMKELGFYRSKSL